MKAKHKNTGYSSKKEIGIGPRIAELRAEYKISQKELARRLKTKQQAISLIEKSVYLPTTTTLQKIAKVFKKKLMVDFK